MSTTWPFRCKLVFLESFLLYCSVLKALDDQVVAWAFPETHPVEIISDLSNTISSTVKYINPWPTWAKLTTYAFTKILKSGNINFDFSQLLSKLTMFGTFFIMMVCKFLPAGEGKAIVLWNSPMDNSDYFSFEIKLKERSGNKVTSWKQWIPLVFLHLNVIFNSQVCQTIVKYDIL